jgi:hypothetical protein
MDEQGFEQHKEALAELAAYLHKVTSLIVLVSFVGYGLAGWFVYKDRVFEAIITASVSYVFFRLFRQISLFVVRRIAVMKGNLFPAMEWLDEQIAQHGTQAVIGEIDRRLFNRD